MVETKKNKTNLPKLLSYRGYMSNQLLKKAGVKVEWTLEAANEAKKCAADPVYFIETFMKIVHVDEGLIPFKLRGYQHEMITNIKDNRRVIMCMARQSGKSTAMIGYILWYILFNSHVTVGLLANKAETAREILGKLQLAYINLPLYIQQGISQGGWNKGSILLENGSRVIAESTSASSVRGYTFNMLCIDEAAHIENWDEFSTSVIPTISSGQTTKMVLVSTPKGLNHFYKLWNNAQPNAKEPNDYKPMQVHWTQVPDRDEKWRINALKELNNDPDKFAQEYECEFMGSSGTLITGHVLKRLMKDYQAPIHEKDGLYKYEDPIKNHKYIMTVDVSEGKGFDYSCIQCIDVTAMPYKQVLVYRSNVIGPSEFAQIIHQIGKSYWNAEVLIEYASLGPQVATLLFEDYDYEGLLSTCSGGQKGKRIAVSGGKQIDRGLKMSVTVREMGCSLIKLLIEQNQLIINDFNTVSEFSTFSRAEGKTKFEAEQGCHDDLVMALVVFAWLSDQQYFQDHTNINTLQHLRDNDVAAIEEGLTPFGFFDRGEPVLPPMVLDFEDIMYKAKKTDQYHSWIVHQEMLDQDEAPLDF